MPFTLPEHVTAGLSLEQQAEDFAIHISKISKEYVPLTRAVLPSRLAHALNHNCCAGHPLLEDHNVFSILSERKITGGVEGDLDH